jgi:very-short-patch-repair endonuclease
MPRPTLPLPEKEIVNLYLDGDTPVSIGKRYGCSREAILRVLRDAKVKTRTIAEDNARRYARMDGAARKAQATAANKAVRGSKRSHDELQRRAAAREGVPRSPNETAVSAALHAMGIAHRVAMPIDTHNVDIGVPSLMLVVELDGGQWHGAPVKAANDRRMEDAAIAAGYRVVRYRGGVLKYPEAIALDVQALGRDPSPFGSERVIWRWVRDLPGRPAHGNQHTRKRTREPAQDPTRPTVVRDHI